MLHGQKTFLEIVKRHCLLGVAFVSQIPRKGHKHNIAFPDVVEILKWKKIEFTRFIQKKIKILRTIRRTRPHIVRSQFFPRILLDKSRVSPVVILVRHISSTCGTKSNYIECDQMYVRTMKMPVSTHFAQRGVFSHNFVGPSKTMQHSKQLVQHFTFIIFNLLGPDCELFVLF